MSTRRLRKPAPAASAARKGDVTRQRILDAAARVLSRKSYTDSRLTDIAAEAGMGAGSLYYYFDSREALIEEVILTGVRRTQQAVAERLERMRPDATSRERLRAAIEEHLLMGLKQSEYSSAAITLLNQLPDEIRARIVAVERAYGRLWHALLEEGRRAGEIRADVNLSVARMAILGALNWSPEWYRPNGASPQRIARDIATLVLDGLCTKRRAGRASAVKE